MSVHKKTIKILSIGALVTLNAASVCAMDITESANEVDTSETAETVALDANFPVVIDETVAQILAIEADIEYGEYLAGECTTCHNSVQIIGEKSDSGVPGIHGADRLSLIENLIAYRRGDRENTTMMAVVKNKADDELSALAAYFSSFEVEVHQ